MALEPTERPTGYSRGRWRRRHDWAGKWDITKSKSFCDLRRYSCTSIVRLLCCAPMSILTERPSSLCLMQHWNLSLSSSKNILFLLLPDFFCENTLSWNFPDWARRRRRNFPPIVFAICPPPPLFFPQPMRWTGEGGVGLSLPQALLPLKHGR